METSLWEAYQERGDADARERLLAEHLRLVHHVARQMEHTVHPDAQLDDLVSAGTIGLMQAIDSFDPGRGIAFSTFAATRIRGAILDDLRRWDPVPRSVRRHQRRLDAAERELRAELDRAPSDDETAERLGIDADTVWRWRSRSAGLAFVRLDQPVATGEPGSATAMETVPGAEGGEEIEADLNHVQEVEQLREHLEALSSQERTVLALYYFEELKLRQIADVLGLTESRISQIRSKALRTLRERMSPLREE